MSSELADRLTGLLRATERMQEREKKKERRRDEELERKAEGTDERVQRKTVRPGHSMLKAARVVKVSVLWAARNVDRWQIFNSALSACRCHTFPSPHWFGNVYCQLDAADGLCSNNKRIIRDSRQTGNMDGRHCFSSQWSDETMHSKTPDSSKSFFFFLKKSLFSRLNYSFLIF